MPYIDFTIIQSSIDNGRIYFDSRHKSFFPADALGGREGLGHATGKVEIEVNGETIETDIRENSGVRISPRKSVKTWLKAHHAVAGNTGRLHRVSDRQFKLEYLG